MDIIDIKLISEIHCQEYARKIIAMPVQEVDKINALSIKSVKQKLCTK